MTLTDSELRAMRTRLAAYSDDMLLAMLEAKRLTMVECLETCPDIMDDTHPLVKEYAKSKTVFNVTMDELDRRKTGSPIESLPGMDPLHSSGHTMAGR